MLEMLGNVQGVGAVILEEKAAKKGEITLLLGKRKSDVIYPGWFFPCGTLEEGETPKDAIVREMKEELGIEVEVIDTLNWRINEDQGMEIIFLCKILTGELKLLDHEDTEEIDYFPINELPEDTNSGVVELLDEETIKKIVEFISAYKVYIQSSQTQPLYHL